MKEIKRNGQSYVQDLENEYFREGDTLVVMADDSFVQTWGESSVFVMLANGKDTEPVASKGKTLVCPCPADSDDNRSYGWRTACSERGFSGYQTGYVLFSCPFTTILMAWTKIFPARKYTKYISWDILITIAVLCHQQGNGKLRSGGCCG